MTDVRDFTDEELERINQKRRKGGLRQLSRQDARRARETHEAADDGPDLMTFMLLFTDYDRGSGGHSPSRSDEATAPAQQSTDWSQPSSGSGYTSDSSSSSDSGSSSSGGDSGGGGGGSD
jgi:hypothetical protein